MNTNTLVAIALYSTLATVHAQEIPADINPASGARIPHLSRVELGNEGKPLADIFNPGSGRDDPLTGPAAYAAYNIPVAKALVALHDGAISGTLDVLTREVATLVACRETNYELEWYGHVRSATKAGLDANVIDVIEHNKPVSGLDPRDAAVIQFGREMLRDRQMSSATFANAKELFGTRGAMDLVAVMITYAASGYYAIAVDEHLPGLAQLPPIK
ncbi:MAG: carboxymuconolactone decarboxylase family protein [Gammaproteobacteria bacterium]|nr:carboxymuconolactone decarboxylase family protein [Gammaproteobacteria bacterium]